MKSTYREEIYRSRKSMDRLKGRLVTVCGAGALGANLVENLARTGLDTLRVIDKDRVEEHNLSTQPYQYDDVGASKAETLSLLVYRATRMEVDAISKELTSKNVSKLLKGSELVIDCFDNSPSRGLVSEHCAREGTECLHVGLADGFAEIIWNEDYTVPGPSQDDICDYPLARNLVLLAVAAASEAIIENLCESHKSSWSITLKDRRLSLLAL